MVRLFNTVMRIITIAAMIGLLGSYTSPYVNPNTFYPSSLLGLAYHYLLIANIILFLYWLFRWKKIAILSFLVIASGYPFITTYYALNPKVAPDAPHDLSILTYNIRQMNANNWMQEKDAPKKIMDYINNSDADIVCIQEFPNRDASFQKFPEYKYRYRNKDVALISSYPIIHKGIIKFPPGNAAACIYADIDVKGDTVRVYAIHLESYRLGNKEERIYKNLTSGNTENATQGVKKISSRLVHANRNRANQAVEIKAHMQQSPYPVIICGDFNDTPLSYAYHTLSTGMTDSFNEKGRGLGNTYIGEFPSFRIDHILHSPSFKTVSYTRDTVRYSDHYPVKTKLKYAPSHR